MKKKKAVYDIGDWVYTDWSSQYKNLPAIILELKVDGLEPIIYKVLIQTKTEPLWMHACLIREML